MQGKWQFSWRHPWSNAADTYLAYRLRERYLYRYPGIGSHNELLPAPPSESERKEDEYG